MVYDRERDLLAHVEVIRASLERGDESWGVGQVILHANRRRRIPMAVLAARVGVSAYRLRKVRDEYVRSSSAG